MQPTVADCVASAGFAGLSGTELQFNVPEAPDGDDRDRRPERRYRSAVLFGQCQAITEPEAKRRASEVITDALIPGRSAEVRASTAKELAAVLVLALPIAEWSLKVSEGWPDDPPGDVAGPAWTGVLPVVQRYDLPLAASPRRPSDTSSASSPAKLAGSRGSCHRC
jgi:hypothetical protein